MQTFKYEDYDLGLNLYNYQNNGALAILASCWDDEYNYWEPFDDITVNLSYSIPAGYAFVNKQYEQFVEENDLGTFTDITMPSGFNEYKLYKFNVPFLHKIALEDEYAEEDYD